MLKRLAMTALVALAPLAAHAQTLRDAERAATDLARVVEGFCARA